jgi:pimeloyl-ACP methyl ester carboxylesterase
MTLGGRPGFSGHPPEVLARAQAILADRIPPSPRFDTAVTGGALAMPVLLVHCRDDRNWSLEGSRALAARMPRARLLETQGLGHRDVARDPAVVAVIADFLSDARRGVQEPPEQTAP